LTQSDTLLRVSTGKPYVLSATTLGRPGWKSVLTDWPD